MGPKVLQVSENRYKQLITRNRSRPSSTKREVTSPDQDKLQEKNYKQTSPPNKTEKKTKRNLVNHLLKTKLWELMIPMPVQLSVLKQMKYVIKKL